MVSASPRNVTVRVAGWLLKQDRKAAGHTQQSFSAACGSVTLSTIRRAEQGKRVVATALARMAAVLGQPADRYILADPAPPEPGGVPAITGQWIQFFVEEDGNHAPYIVEEVVTLQRHGARIGGTIETRTPWEKRSEQIDFAGMAGPTLYYVTRSDVWPPPAGLSVVIQKLTRGGDWLEGFAAWHDLDSDRIEMSRVIAIRPESRYAARYRDDALEIMQRELALFRLRALLRAGCGLAEACRLVSR